MMKKQWEQLIIYGCSYLCSQHTPEKPVTVAFSTLAMLSRWQPMFPRGLCRVVVLWLLTSGGSMRWMGERASGICPPPPLLTRKNWPHLLYICVHTCICNWHMFSSVSMFVIFGEAIYMIYWNTTAAPPPFWNNPGQW